jgi:predicted phosphoribosyltransferase
VLESGVDIVICHKLGAPGNAELAFGAVCEGGVSFVNERLALYVGAGERYIEGEKRRQLEAIRRKVEMYRAVVEKIPLEKRVVIVTDDGVATGATMQAALWAVRREKPEKIVLALPVGSEEAVLRLSKDADETICLKVPPYFDAVGRFYVEFGQVEDSELLQLLADEMERRNAE